jgi:hypothetical protein
VSGKLITADRDKVRRLFTEALPVLRAGQDCSKFLLTPLMRYIGKPCCNNPSHITNRNEASYFQNIAEKLKELKGSLNGLAFTRWLHNFAVICPHKLLKSQEDSAKTAALLMQDWAEDPVHMTNEGYQDLSRKILEFMVEADLRATEQHPAERGHGLGRFGPTAILSH